ncbi:MAG: hypothetical protein QG581_137 [Patescibacteria group bacterium]|nr:hypothetical protein [Patescibacteria group bacterium]
MVKLERDAMMEYSEGGMDKEIFNFEVRILIEFLNH